MKSVPLSSFLLSGFYFCTLAASAGENFSTNQTEEIKQIPAHNKERLVDFTHVAKKAIPAVVWIRVKGTEKAFHSESENSYENPFSQKGDSDLWDYFNLPHKKSSSPIVAGQGSGVIVSSDGKILTNSHVVRGMESILVQLYDGRELPAKVLGDDPNSELALIKIEANGLPYLTLGDSDALQVGQWVSAIGNPFGLQATLTVGVVSAKGRSNLDLARYEDFIQTDTAINKGNSGGPLLNLDGEIIGINTAIASSTGSGYLEIGFAVPSNMAKHVIEEILSEGKIYRGFLGLSLQGIDYSLAQAFGLKKVQGALVSQVVKDSPAEKAGLKVEDILLSYNSIPIENAATLKNAVYRMKPGSKITLSLIRDSREMEIPVILSEISEKPLVVANEESQLGIEVETITPEMARVLGLGEEKGVIISRIIPSSVAALAGLKKGILILSVNREKVSSAEAFNRLVGKVKRGDPILLKLKLNDSNLFIVLKLD